jgi:hypothetical protein
MVLSTRTSQEALDRRLQAELAFPEQVEPNATRHGELDRRGDGEQRPSYVRIADSVPRLN